MEFIYKLILRQDLFIESNWTVKEELIVNEHFNYLTNLKDKGILILAGKTSGLDESTYGICIFKADTLEKARQIMNNDPAIVNGVMTGLLQEFNVALINT